MPIFFHLKNKTKIMISFTSLGISFSLKNKLLVRSWVKSIVNNEEKIAGDITYVFCDDEYLGSMNEKYLKHHTLTDIITFDYSEKGKLSGDICISIDRIEENARSYKTSFYKELGRVMAHGVLHLSGYKDKTSEEKKIMRSKEDLYLESFPNS
jgi:probable rRNA maturation factor